MDSKAHRIIQHLIDGPNGTRGIVIALGVQDLSAQGNKMFLYCGDSYLSIGLRQIISPFSHSQFLIVVTRYKDGVEGGLQMLLPAGGELTSKTHNLFREMVIKLLDKDPYLF